MLLAGRMRPARMPGTALDHNILPDKLHYYGVRNTPLDLFKNYLTNRKQYVEIDSVKSKMGEIQTGVPQGSILGPLLFIIYINDIKTSTELFNVITYADDTGHFGEYIRFVQCQPKSKFP